MCNLTDNHNATPYINFNAKSLNNIIIYIMTLDRTETEVLHGCVQHLITSIALLHKHGYSYTSTLKWRMIVK